MYEGRKGVRQINKAQYDERYAAAMNRWETPVSQQTLESHVLVPLMIAGVISIFCMGITAAIIIVFFDLLSNYSIEPLDPITTWTIGTVLMTGALGFLSSFLWRIGVGDSLLMQIEELLGEDLDGDGEVGFAPRSVPINTKNGTHDIPLENAAAELYRRDWQQVAIAILNKRGNVSWRGIYDNCKLSQSQSQAAAKYLKKGYVMADGVSINGRGWDYLIAYLPEHTLCMIERPADPPTPL